MRMRPSCSFGAVAACGITMRNAVEIHPVPAFDFLSVLQELYHDSSILQACLLDRGFG